MVASGKGSVRLALRAFLILGFLFLYAPILVLIVFSFNESRSRSAWTGFSLSWYAQLFRDRQIMASFGWTLAIALLAAMTATLLGTAAALGIDALGRKWKGRALNLAYLPILNPDIVTGISLMLLFLFFRMKLGFLSMLLAHITVDTSYVILAVLPRLSRLDPHLVEAALDLGARPLRAYRRVIFPEIAPGILTGALLAFTLSLDDFIISFFTSGSGVTNLSITIYSMARRGINPKINALSTLMFVAVLALLTVVNAAMRGASKKGAENV